VDFLTFLVGAHRWRSKGMPAGCRALPPKIMSCSPYFSDGSLGCLLTWRMAIAPKERVEVFGVVGWACWMIFARWRLCGVVDRIFNALLCGKIKAMRHGRLLT
jgi:hypothetical protein